MSISKHEEKMLNLQHQMRENQADLQNYLADLDNWEGDIKQKEQKLMTGDVKVKESPVLPPVRNSIQKPKFKKKKKEKKPEPNSTKKISGYDFRAWDKFDVDKALEEIDGEEEKKETSSSEYETDEEWEIERKKHLATEQKDQGNLFFKNGQWDRAVEAYSKGIELDATNAVLPANRAMALLKQQKFAAAELDCTSSISLDPLYVKAYLRRATARVGLNKYLDATEDYNRVLDLEPTNKLAKSEIERIQKELDRAKEKPLSTTLTENNTGIIKPVYKPPEERSKAPLRRIHIEEIGIQSSSTPSPALDKQSQQAKKITEQESRNFNAILSSTKSNSSKPNNASSKFSKDDVSPDSQKQRQNSPSDQDIPSHAQETKDTEGSPKKVAELHSEQLPLKETNSEKKKEVKVVDKPLKEVKENGIHRPEKPKSVPGDTEEKFEIPQTSFQFQKDFKLLKKKSTAFFNYFKVISPSQYPKLFGQCLDAYILMTIVRALLDNSEGTDINVYEILLGLTKVNRFSMTAMFLSNQDKKDLQSLTKQIVIKGEYSDKDVSALKQKYSL